MNMNFNNINIQPIRIEDIELMRKWRNNENDKGVFFNNKYNLFLLRIIMNKSNIFNIKDSYDIITM